MVRAMLKILSIVDNAFHAIGAAERFPPDNSAHVSAHSSVILAIVTARQAQRQARLAFDFENARKRAGKKGRNVEMTKQRHDHWG